MPSSPLQLNPTVRLMCTDIVNHSNIYIRPQELVTITTPDAVDRLIEKKIGSQTVQSCSKDGYVLSSADSARSRSKSSHVLYKPLQILTRSPGEIPPEHLNGAFVYRVCYSHYVCNPPIHVVIPAVVCEKNKLGIRCHYYPYTYDRDTNEVSSGDVVRANAQFVAIFLPKALHCNLQYVGTGMGVSGVDEEGVDGEGDADGAPPKKSPKELYETEEARIDASESHEATADTLASYSPNRVIVHVRILQKRFDMNDKQISAVGVLDATGYAS